MRAHVLLTLISIAVWVPVSGCPNVPPSCVENDADCDGSSRRLCESNGGWAWLEDCADSGLLCIELTESATACCQCTPGATSCNVTEILVCNAVPGGCGEWAVDEDCTLSGGTCDDTTGSPMCVSACGEACTMELTARCVNDAVETCTLLPAGCLSWTVSADCAAAGMTCYEMMGVPAQCTCPPNICALDGDSFCNGTVIETCTLQANGCLELVPGIDCAATMQTCDSSTQPAVCS